MLNTHSERIKCVDIHETEPWALHALYSGQVTIWNWATQSLLRTIEVGDLPVRAARFIPQKGWIVVGCDNLSIKFYSVQSGDLVTTLEAAHSDYIRDIAVHPTRPLIITVSDDMTIKEWDWERNFKCICTHEGHAHYIMSVTINPRDGGSTFATASLDRTVKVWTLGVGPSNYTLEGSPKGVNTVSYVSAGDVRPYLLSGGDDNTLRIWDLPTRSCVRVLSGHTQPVTSVCPHPYLPLIISASEDGTIRFWDAASLRPDTEMRLSLGRLWCLATRKAGEIVIGGDEGSSTIIIGADTPAASVDNQGRLLVAKGPIIIQTNVHQVIENDPDLSSRADFESKIFQLLTSSASKELSSDLFPVSITHSSNGRFIAVVGGSGEWIIYSALAWRNRAFGRGTSFSWSSLNSHSTDFCVKESTSKIVVYKDFNPAVTIQLPSNSTAENVFGGPLIGVSTSEGQLLFYDWHNGILLRQIDVHAVNLFWSADGTRVAVCTRDDGFYILLYDQSKIHIDDGSDEGSQEEAFELIASFEDRILSGAWSNEAFIFRSGTKISYCIEQVSLQLCSVSIPVSIVGYVRDSRCIVLVDRDATVFALPIPVPLIAYQTAIICKDFDAASRMLPDISHSLHHRLALFLQTQGFPALAWPLQFTDDTLRINLALSLNRIDDAAKVAAATKDPGHLRAIAESALVGGKETLDLAESAILSLIDGGRYAFDVRDLSTLHLIRLARGDVAGVYEVGCIARFRGVFNLAFSCFLSTAHLLDCFDLLMAANRFPEAAVFARTYMGDIKAVAKAVEAWKSLLRNSGKSQFANMILIPDTLENVVNVAPLRHSDALDCGQNLKNSEMVIITHTEDQNTELNFSKMNLEDKLQSDHPLTMDICSNENVKPEHSKNNENNVKPLNLISGDFSEQIDKSNDTETVNTQQYSHDVNFYANGHSGNNIPDHNEEVLERQDSFSKKINEKFSDEEFCESYSKEQVDLSQNNFGQKDFHNGSRGRRTSMDSGVEQPALSCTNTNEQSQTSDLMSLEVNMGTYSARSDDILNEEYMIGGDFSIHGDSDSFHDVSSEAGSSVGILGTRDIRHQQPLTKVSMNSLSQSGGIMGGSGDVFVDLSRGGIERNRLYTLHEDQGFETNSLENGINGEIEDIDLGEADEGWD